jgi:ankyrin repeat protein
MNKALSFLKNFVSSSLIQKIGLSGNVSLKDDEGEKDLKQKLIHFLVSGNNLKALNHHLTKKDIEIDEKDVNGESALHYACKSPINLQILKSLIEHKSNINLQNNNGGSPLHFASNSHFNLDAVKLLLSNGAHPNLKDKDGLTPFKVARKFGNKEIEELIKNF